MEREQDYKETAERYKWQARAVVRRKKTEKRKRTEEEVQEQFEKKEVGKRRKTAGVQPWADKARRN